MITMWLSNIDLQKLVEQVSKLDFWKDGSNAEMAVAACAGLPYNTEELGYAILEVETLTKRKPIHMMINRLQPGVIVPIHTDTLRIHGRPKPIKLARWHLPLKTNDKSWWWDEVNGRLHMKEGVWYGEMPYWRNHQVGNEGESERIHLVVDLE